EGLPATLRRPGRAGCHRVPLPAGDEQVEQGGAPPVLVYQHQLAGQAPEHLRDRHQTLQPDNDPQTLVGPLRPPRQRLRAPSRGAQRHDDTPAPGRASRPPQMELHHTPPSVVIALYTICYDTRFLTGPDAPEGDTSSLVP